MSQIFRCAFSLGWKALQGEPSLDYVVLCALTNIPVAPFMDSEEENFRVKREHTTIGFKHCETLGLKLDC